MIEHLEYSYGANGELWISNSSDPILRWCKLEYIVYDFSSERFHSHSYNVGSMISTNSLIERLNERFTGVENGRSRVVYLGLINCMTEDLLMYDALHPVWVPASTGESHDIRVMSDEEQVDFFMELVSRL